MIAALIEHLKNNTHSFIKIDYAHDLESNVDDSGELPQLFLFPGNEGASGDGIDLMVSARHSMRMHIHIACKHADLEALKTELRTAVIGWNPDPDAGYDDMEFRSGELMNLKGGIAWWEDIYSTWRTLREAY